MEFIKLNEIETVELKKCLINGKINAKYFESCKKKYLIFNSDVFKGIGVGKFRKIKQNYDFILIFDANSSSITREVVEKGFFDIIINSEFHKNKDFVYQTNSGMDQVILKIMRKKKIKYGFDFLKVNKSLNEKARFMLPRFRQNYLLSLKLGIKLVCIILNKRDNVEVFFS